MRRSSASYRFYRENTDYYRERGGWQMRIRPYRSGMHQSYHYPRRAYGPNIGSEELHHNCLSEYDKAQPEINKEEKGENLNTEEQKDISTNNAAEAIKEPISSLFNEINTNSKDLDNKHEEVKSETCAQTETSREASTTDPKTIELLDELSKTKEVAHNFVVKRNKVIFE